MRFLFACLLVARASALQLRMSAAAPVKAAAAAPSAAAIKASYVLSSPRFRKGVKQVSTLGPASFDAAVIERLFLEGTDVFRLNLSHGASDKLEVAQCIRALEVKYDHPIGILADLQGPKHRVGMFSKDVPKVNLVKGQVYTFDLDSDTFGSESRVALPHPEVLQALEVGNAILLDDGKLRCVVTEKGDGFVVTEVMNDAALSSRKGFNLPDTVVPGEAMTPKDIADLEFLMEDFGGVTIDWIALSFVQRPEDMIELKTRINGRSKAMLLAKLEKPQAVEPDQLRAIVAACDGIMVARGDLGVEMAAEDVPIVQKEIIDECRAQGKPVIVATQMLESMIDSPSPTRAECSDVATAIFDGCDAVMLSGESAAGKYPIEAVAMQRSVAKPGGKPGYRKTQRRGPAERPHIRGLGGPAGEQKSERPQGEGSRAAKVGRWILRFILWAHGMPFEPRARGEARAIGP